MIIQPPALADYSDTFDRANSSDLGAAWRPEFGNMVIATNRAQARAVPSGTTRTGNWETYIGDYGGRLFTDTWELVVPLLAPVGSASSVNFTAFGVGMQDAGPAAGMLLVYVAASRVTAVGGGVRLVTWSGSSIPSPGNATGMTGQTFRAGDNVAVPATATLTLQRRMYSATQSNFTVLLNGSTHLTWNDNTGVVPAGDPYRRRWFACGEVNYPSFQQSIYSPALAQIRARDITT